MNTPHTITRFSASAAGITFSAPYLNIGVEGAAREHAEGLRPDPPVLSPDEVERSLRWQREYYNFRDLNTPAFLAQATEDEILELMTKRIDDEQRREDRKRSRQGDD